MEKQRGQLVEQTTGGEIVDRPDAAGIPIIPGDVMGIGPPVRELLSPHDMPPRGAWRKNYNTLGSHRDVFRFVWSPNWDDK